MVCHMLSVFCSSVAPNPNLLASHLTPVSLSTSKCLFSTIFAICVFMFSNVSVCLSSHFNLFDAVTFSFFSNGRNGSDILAKCGVNLIQWCMLPMNDLSCLRVFGMSSFCNASVLVINGVTPCGVILNPIHSIYCFANSHFCKLIASTFLFSRSSIISNVSSCSFSFPFVAINMSSNVICQPNVSTYFDRFCFLYFLLVLLAVLGDPFGV